MIRNMRTTVTMFLICFFAPFLLAQDDCSTFNASVGPFPGGHMDAKQHATGVHNDVYLMQGKR